LEKNLRKKFIRPSSSFAASFVLFVEKADEGVTGYARYVGIGVKKRYP
jgi:hypothetical protein